VPTLVQRLNRPIIALLAVAAIAGGIRFWALSRPTSLVFDEYYYPKAGCIFIGWSNKQCQIQSSDEKYWRNAKWDVGSWVHPPLGKWEIGLGIKAFGMTPFGWRFTTALEGTLVAVLVALIAQLLFGSALWTFVAGLLISVESLNVVLSRVALLDTHLEFWVVVGFLCLVLDHRWIDRRTPLPRVDEDDAGGTFSDPAREFEAGSEAGQIGWAFDDPGGDPSEGLGASEPVLVSAHLPSPPRIPSPVWRPWRFAAGAAFGAASAVKWSGATALLGAVVLTYAWETTRRTEGDVTRGHAFGRAFARETFGIVLAFAIVPAAVYLATWLPWFHHFGWSLKEWWKDQQAMWDYHKGLKATAYDPKTKTYTPTHDDYSRPWTWLFMLRPVNMFEPSSTGGRVQQILAIGNPAIFWASFWTLPFAAFAWRRMRDWRAGFMLVAALVIWLPWFLVSRPQFFFYVLPVTPFLVLAATYSLRWLSDATWIVRDPERGVEVESTRHPYRPLVWIYVALAVGVFAWFYPVLTGRDISTHTHQVILWFQRWS
jgi:dolichyl-phosphate-mannose-protein mannosyltransferase